MNSHGVLKMETSINCNDVAGVSQTASHLGYKRFVSAIERGIPTSGRGKKQRRLQNRVYKRGELLLCRWFHKPWE